MFVPLIAICYFPWFTKNGVSFGFVVGIITVFFAEHIGQLILVNIINLEKWPFTIHSSFWGVFLTYSNNYWHIFYNSRCQKKLITNINFMIL